MKKKLLKVLVICLCWMMVACEKEEVEEEPKIVFQTLSFEQDQREAYSSLEPITYSYEREESILGKQGISIEDGKAYSNGYWWIASKTNKGSPKKESSIYKYVYDIDGNLLSKTEVTSSKEYIEAEDIIYKYYGKIESGSIFYPSSFTKFGYNCRGCYVNESNYTVLSSGIAAGPHSIQQYDGTWEEGITYEGYYLIAMTTDIPICTLVEVSGHSFKGEGLEPGVPFKAIVADRGVAANHVDLFVGDENNLGIVQKTRKRNNIKVTILSFGKRVKHNGKYTCSV